MRFSRQEYWSGLPYPSPGDLPHPGIKPGSLALQVDSLLSEPPGKSPHNANININTISSNIKILLKFWWIQVVFFLYYYDAKIERDIDPLTNIFLTYDACLFFIYIMLSSLTDDSLSSLR